MWNIMECFGFMLQTVLLEVPLSILFYQKLKGKHSQKLKSTLLHRFRQLDKAKLLLLKFIRLFAREVLLEKTLEIEETKTT